MVLAGYAAVGSHNLGVVTKIDLTEVRAPYIRAGLLSSGIAILATLLWTLLFLRLTQPLLRRITESEERFRQLSNSLPQFVWTCLPNGRYDFLSDKWVAYTGIPAEPQLGFGWLEQLHPDDREPTAAAWNTAVASGSDFHVELRIRRHDGEYRWFDTRAVRLHDAHGRTAKWFGTNTDITERKHAETEQVRLNDALRLKNVELEQHIYAVSHDLRTPLVSVQGFAGELKIALEELSALLAGPEQGTGQGTRLCPGTRSGIEAIPVMSPVCMSLEVRAKVTRLLDEEIPTSLRYILAGVEKMGGRLAGLLRLSRLGRAVLKVERLDMNRLAAGAVAAQAYRIRQAGAKVELGDLPPCRADAGQVDQVLANLLDNAIKYRDPTRPLVVKLTGQRQRDVVTYCVEDNGIGMPPELHQRVFELFYQANPSHAEGDGLGLTIVRRALRRLGGEIIVESEPGKGSRFRFALPAGETEEG
jgi:PAS domain S-box-containing protein